MAYKLAGCKLHPFSSENVVNFFLMSNSIFSVLTSNTILIIQMSNRLGLFSTGVIFSRSIRVS